MHNRKIVPVPPGGKNFVHVADVANGICNAIDRGKSGTCYLMANENLSYSEFYSKLEKAYGRSFYQLKLAPRFLNVLGTIGTLAVKSGFRSDLNLINAKILCVGNYYSSARAVSELGLPQTPVDKAIADALEWFAQAGYIKN